MPNGRKGLKRYGMRAYLVEGPRGAIVIRRMGARHFSLRKKQYDAAPWGFFGMRFHTLGDAATFAREEIA